MAATPSCDQVRVGRPSAQSLDQHALESFRKAAQPTIPAVLEEESTNIISSGRAARTGGSFTTILEMISATLAIVPSRYQQHGPVPLPTKTLDDLTATVRAVSTHSDAPHRLPSHLLLTTQRRCLAPKLIAPPSTVWLPSDNAGVARAEARDLEQFHGLKAVIEVRSSDDVILRRRLCMRLIKVRA